MIHLHSDQSDGKKQNKNKEQRSSNANETIKSSKKLVLKIANKYCKGKQTIPFVSFSSLD